MATQDISILRQESLSRAIQGESLANYPAIYEGFAAKGIPEDQIKPRENVFSYQAWKALGRQVRKGEHGVRICTFRQFAKVDKQTGEEKTFSSPWHVTVFHVSQTDKVGGAE